MRTSLTVFIIALAALGAASVGAQMPGGAYERLAPGDQRIARSLHDAQRRTAPSGTRLTLDQIASRKNGEGWGRVFKDMKTEGLVSARTLHQVVNRGGSHGVVRERSVRDAAVAQADER